MQPCLEKKKVKFARLQWSHAALLVLLALTGVGLLMALPALAQNPRQAPAGFGNAPWPSPRILDQAKNQHPDFLKVEPGEPSFPTEGNTEPGFPVPPKAHQPAVGDPERSEQQQRPETATFWQKYLAGSAHGKWREEWGSALAEPGRAVANRTSLRLQWERMVGEKFFARVDGKGQFLAGNDHQSLAAGREGGMVENDLREAFLQWSRGAFSAKVGRQVVAWGETEITVATDIISPRNLSEFLFVSLEDARLGQDMINLDFFGATGQWSFLLVPAPRVDRLPQPGSEYAMPLPEDNPAYAVSGPRPGGSLENSEWGIRWWRGFSQGDLSLMAASVLENQPSYRLDSSAGGVADLTRLYPRYEMAGVAANFTRGNLLLRGELALKAGRTFAAANPTLQESLLTRDTVDSGLTLEYATSGRHQWVVSWGNRHVMGWSSDLAVKKNEGSLLAAWSREFLYETLQVSMRALALLPRQDWFYLGNVAYKFTDHWRGELELALVEPASETSLLAPMDDKDRLTLRLGYAF